jgi:hypothetical protein
VTDPGRAITEWLIAHARADVERGRPVPDAVLNHIRTLVSGARADETGPAETIEIGVPEMARRTGYAVSTIRDRCARGIYDAYRDGRDWRIRIKGRHGEDDTDADAR